MDEYELIELTPAYKQQYLKMVEENFDELNEIGFSDSFPLSNDSSFENDAENLRKMSLGIGLPNGYVPATTLFLLDTKNNKIVGGINIRHCLTDKLLFRGGHIGYYICKNERKKGLAKMILKKGLSVCKNLGIEDVLVSCSKNNIASAKTIQANGGILEDERDDNGELFQRYWIKT
jgi:predicted acetyltransferase